MNPYMELAGSKLVLWASPRDKDLVVQIPGTTFDRGLGLWTLPVSWASVVAALGVFGGRVQMGPDLVSWAAGCAAHLADLSSLKTAPADGHNPDLYDFQATGSKWLAGCLQGLLTDEQGTGKTIQLLDALRFIAPAHLFPVLLICTNSMKHMWKEEWETWGPDTGGIVVVGGTPTQKRKQFAADASVWIVNWEALRVHSRLAPFGSQELTPKEKEEKELDEIGFKSVFADECHRAVDPNAKQTRAWWNLSHKADNRIGMTGTPVVKRPSDLWSLMHAVRPQDFPRKTKFVERYCNAGQGLYGYEIWGLKEATKAELFSFLDPRMLRRTKAEVLPQLPAKTYTYRRVDMEGKQAKAYADLKKEMMTADNTQVLTVDSPLTLAGRLCQVAAATPVLGEVQRTNKETGEEETVVTVTELTMPSCKVSALLDLLDEATGEPVVVFAASKLLLRLAAKKLAAEKITTVSLTGDVDPAARAQLIQAFQDGKAQVALCTFGAVAEGVTLTRASRLIFLQRSWSNVQNRQAEDRIHRIGQEGSKVEIVMVVTNDSIEADVLARGEENEGYLQEIVRDHLR